MSMETWKAEFYPIEAHAASASAIEATKHSLKKWTGLRLPVLQQHELKLDDGIVSNNNRQHEFSLTCRSCALCHWTARTTDTSISDPDCKACPLYETVGHECLSIPSNPWHSLVKLNDPEPMIAALQTTLTRLEKGVLP